MQVCSVADEYAYYTITVTQQTPVIGTPGSGGFTVTLTSVNGYVAA